MLLVLKILNFRTSKFCHQSGIIKVETKINVLALKSSTCSDGT